MELATYTEKIRNLAEYYFREEKPLSTTKRCCISLKHNELSITNIDRHSEVNEILLLEKLKFDDIKSLPLVLNGIAEKHKLSLTPVTWLVGPDDYQVNIIESMPVPANEFKTALNWRIRSLITYPIDEAVMEYFELPSKKNSPNTPLICAVTAQKNKLNQVISLLKECNINITRIDIPELALLNLAALYETDEKSSAFLYFYEKHIILNISCQKTLYFTRHIPLSPASDGTIDYEKLSLEILRYFDFFRSQWRLSSPTRIFAATEKGDIHTITKILAERLLNPVEVYTLNKTIINDKEKNEISSKYLLDYGCLLRQESKDA